MEINDITVTTTTKTSVPWGEALIMPFGDIQYGAQGVDMDRFKRDFDWGMEHDAWFIGMGDMVDILSPSNRAKMRNAGFYDSFKMAAEEVAYKHMEELMDVVRGSEGRWLGLHEGHHFWEFSDGGTTDTKMADMLQTSFLGTCALTRITMKQSNGSATSLKYDIWSHHGSGSGAALTAPLNKLEKVAGAFDADMFLINHYQRAGVIPKDWLYVNNRGILKHKSRYLVATGGYMRGYTQGNKEGKVARGSYVEQALMIPTNLGGAKIFLTPDRKNNQITADVMV